MTIYLYDMASFNCNTFNSKLIDALIVSSDDAPEWTNVQTGSQTHFPKKQKKTNKNANKNNNKWKKNKKERKIHVQYIIL